jgi:hypothetical protein
MRGSMDDKRSGMGFGPDFGLNPRLDRPKSSSQSVLAVFC